MGVMQMLDHIKTDYKGPRHDHRSVKSCRQTDGAGTSPCWCHGNNAHKFTKDTGEMARQADILISAVGKPGLVPGSGSRRRNGYRRV